jgi:hypothetical protein
MGTAGYRPGRFFGLRHARMLANTPVYVNAGRDREIWPTTAISQSSFKSFVRNSPGVGSPNSPADPTATAILFLSSLFRLLQAAEPQAVRNGQTQLLPATSISHTLAASSCLFNVLPDRGVFLLRDAARALPGQEGRTVGKNVTAQKSGTGLPFSRML